jgi:hypothetical protein
MNRPLALHFQLSSVKAKTLASNPFDYCLWGIPKHFEGARKKWSFQGTGNGSTRRASR